MHMGCWDSEKLMFVTIKTYSNYEKYKECIYRFSCHQSAVLVTRRTKPNEELKCIDIDEG
jgi:hypothetical protein